MIREAVKDIQLSIRKISEKASEQDECVRMDIGQPSFDTPQHVKDAARERIEEQQGYTSTLGTEDLRRRIADEESDKKGVEIDSDQVLVTVGGMQALYAIYAARLGPDATVALNDPCWGPYKLISGINGNKFSQVEYWDENGELRDEARQEIKKADAVIVNTPSNPTGKTLSREQAKEIAEFSDDSGTYLVSDEVYHRLSFDEHHSPAAFSQNSAVIGSVSKNHAMTGWRVGWIVDEEPNVREYAKATRAMTASPPKISQLAAEEALSNDHHVEEMKQTYQERRDIVVERMSSLGWEFETPGGAIYAFPEVDRDSWDFCLEMVEKGVAMVPGEPFGPESDQNVRICFGSVEKDEIRRAFDIIEEEL